MPSEKRQVESTIFTIEIKGQKIFVTHNGETKEHRKSFWLKLTLNDLIEYAKDSNKSITRK